MTSDQNSEEVVSPLAEVAHELRSPIGGVEAMARLLADTGLTPEQRRLVDGLCAAAAHLRAVADDIIDEGALRVGRLSIDESPTELKSLLEPLAIAAEARARGRGLSFDLAYGDDLSAMVYADGRRIRQMLENLIDNAVKVTGQGGIFVSLDLLDRRDSFDGLRFSVRDTGPGLTSEQVDGLFRSFRRIDNGIAGSGLGLSLVRRLARAMGGEAGCDSAPGSGSTFWFTLRLRRFEPASLGRSREAADVQPGRILIVDDNHANRMIMAAVLDHFGFAVAEAASAEEALDVLPDGGFAAVMLDHTLPGMTGLEALKRIRGMAEPLRSTPVIPVTGRVSGADRGAFEAAGADGFVEKPVTARAVREALDAALAARLLRVA